MEFVSTVQHDAPPEAECTFVQLWPWTVKLSYENARLAEETIKKYTLSYSDEHHSAQHNNWVSLVQSSQHDSILFLICSPHPMCGLLQIWINKDTEAELSLKEEP